MSMAASAQKTSHVIVGGSVFGGGKSANVGGKSTVLIDQAGAVIEKDVYGGGAFANVDTINKNLQNTVTLVQGTVNQDIYGGGLGDASHAAKVYGPVQVNINGGQARNVFGCNNENGAPQTTVQVNITNGTVNQNVFGGGNLAHTTICPVVYINGGTVGQDVYGGGALANTGGSTVNIMGGIITRNIYGGGLGDSISLGEGHSNIAAIVDGEVRVNIGAVDNTNPSSPVYSGSATIGGSVYGCNNINGTPKYNVFVDVYQTDHNETNSYPDPEPTLEQLLTPANDNCFAIKAVYGGGNQAAYNPVDNTKTAQVHIYTCANTIQTVYGGGNAADATKVHTIVDGGRFDRVFGGGNGYSETNNHDDPTAPNYNPGANISVSATTDIHGGLYRQVYGGSNQWGNIASALLSIDKESGCSELIAEAFGGANEANLGTVGTPVNLVTSLLCSDINIGNFYGGSNLANIIGNVTLNVYGGNYTNVFGGSKGRLYQDAVGEEGQPGYQPAVEAKSADISGDVTLNLYGGTMTNAFGGSDINGNITGPITVNVLDYELTDCGLDVTNIYGGGNWTAYTPSYTVGEGELRITPVVNVMHVGVIEDDPGTVANESKPGIRGNVYGGGKGDVDHNALVTANPKVNIGYTDDMSSLVPSDYFTIAPSSNADDFNAIVVGSVFGGGDEAGVSGSTTVIMQKPSSSVATLFGGGNLADISGSSNVMVLGGTISQEVYGGGALADVGTSASDSTVVTLAGGTIGNVYGGGLGRKGSDPVQAKVYGNVKVKALGGTVTNVFGCNNLNGAPQNTVQVIVNDTTIAQNMTVTNVFGGGNEAPYGGTPNVDIINGTVTGCVYGGGNEAGVAGGDVVMTGGTVLGGLYGGCNTSGTVTSNILVNVTGGTIGTNDANSYDGIYGGGFGAGTSTDGNVTVAINGSGINVYGDVYGGSAKGHVNDASNDNTTVTLTAGTIHGDLYGGGLGDNTNSATVNGAVQVTVNGGTVTGGVYGCNNVNGAPQSTVKVDIYGTDTPASEYALGNVFGGGNQAAFGGTPEVTIHNCDNSIEYVYGGGNKASVGNTLVKVYGGNTIGYVFAGGNGDGMGTNTMVSGNAAANIYGGTIAHVFGGNNHAGTIVGSTAVYVNKETETGHESCAMKVGEVYGGGNEANGNAGTIDIDCTGTWTDAHNNHNSTNNRIGYELEGIGTVYGGANNANINNGITVTINSGIVENVFGGNNLDGTISGSIQVEIDSTSGSNTCSWYVGNVYGGGNQATYGTGGDSPVVNIKRGLVSGDVFGGGLGLSGNPNKGKVIGNPQVTVNSDKARVNGNVYGGGSLALTQGNPLVTLTEGALTKVFGGGKAASVTGAPTVAITGGTVSTGVYGGCDSQGNVSGNITVNVTGGVIGSSTSLSTHTTADVYGGGYGQTTTTSGNVEVNIGTANPSSHNDFPKIYGDVYGGSAFGDVNSATASTPNTTTVNVNNGTLYTETGLVNGFTVYYGGNVYGGGLGDSGHEAKVYGLVNVNIGSGDMNSIDPRFTENTYGEAIIQGNVYGCNNANGSPQQNVIVNIYKTYMPADTSYTATYLENDGVHGDPKYVLANVFGGGNEANFQVTEKTATVNIYGCDNTIRRTFGGSNAAASDSVFTMIQGGRIHEAFGGGNGEVSPADVNGNVTLAIHGGKVDQSFGGSNQQGTISGSSNVTIDSEGGCGESVIEEFYCGGNFADYYGDIDATIDCAAGLHIQNLYGGCKQADVLPDGNHIGNVHLVVNGGTYENIFGGSQGRLEGTDPEHPTEESADISGHILLEIHGGTVTNAIFGGSHILGSVAGTITVNIEDKNTGCPLDLSAADVYGGGYQADYVTPTVAGHDEAHDYPQVNIKNATVKNVFGGGLEAKVKGNPQIRIKKGSKVLGNVYGGGNLGELEGNPKVIVNGKDETENPHVFPSITLPNPTNDK